MTLSPYQFCLLRLALARLCDWENLVWQRLSSAIVTD